MNNLSAAKSNSKGEINLQWDSDGRAVSYIIEIAHTNHSKDIMWKVPDIISDPKYTVTHLKSSKNYRFRVASVNKNGRGKLSNDVVKKAP